ncbi:MAG: HAD hydrolase-like protein [Candidatus Pacebacteria bacterium]|nr:HAD hydrolase-like protein [Candidatus Paceibacterota bacterium]
MVDNNCDLSKVKVIVWDVEGVLYDAQARIKQLQAYIVQELQTKRPDLDHQAATRHYQKFLNQLNSKTAVLAKILHLSYSQAAKCFDQLEFNQQVVSPNPQLVNFLKQLKAQSYQQYLFTNLLKHQLLQVLQLLGFELWEIHSVFKELITLEKLVQPKPALSNLKQLIKQARTSNKTLAADNFLMVGDRVKADLAPAKKLGMQTALISNGNLASLQQALAHRFADLVLTNPLQLSGLFS